MEWSVYDISSKAAARIFQRMTIDIIMVLLVKYIGVEAKEFISDLSIWLEKVISRLFNIIWTLSIYFRFNNKSLTMIESGTL